MSVEPDVDGVPVEHLDVLVVGAGLSGIGAACRLRTESPWATFAVLESREALGGTWDLFRYPGIRSDSDMFTLGYPFRPWPEGESIADGASILRYLQDTATEFGVDRHIRYRHRVVACDFDSGSGRWAVRAERTDADGTVTPVRFTCTWITSCTGYYRYDRGHQPDFPGADEFRGRLVHPQFWPDDLDVEGRRVVVIGSGATAITLVPALARNADHVTMLQRSPTYVASLPRTNPVTSRIRRVLPRRWHGPVLRWSNTLTTQGFYRLSRSRPALVKRALRKGLERELPAGYDIDTHFAPRYDPWDQRLCVDTDGDLFAGIRSGRVEVVTDHVDRFTADGIRLRSGRELPADVVVTATGLDLLFLGGIELSVDGEPVDVTERMAYKGMMLEGVPNLAMAIGYTNASWTLKSDLTCRYVCRLLNHLRSSGATACTPVAEGVGVSNESLMGLTSGYVLRARDRMPRQGDRAPWRVEQSYLRDLRAMRLDGLGEGLRFTGGDAGSGVGGDAGSGVGGDAGSGVGGDAGRRPAAVAGRTNETSRRVRGMELRRGQVAAVTGAGSGIGRALAVELAGRGLHVALCDVDADGLADTVGRCEGRGVKVTSAVVDVADRDAVFAWAADVVAEHGSVDLVVNNAGVALTATVEQMTEADARWLIDINFWGVVHGTQAFLPHLLAARSGHIVNISSVFGLVGIPTQSAYCAAKFAVRGFTDSLRVELEAGDTGVSCTTVHPGGIRTNIVRNARNHDSATAMAGGRDEMIRNFDRAARTSPERAASRILHAVEHDRRRLLIGPDARLFELIARLPAGVGQRILIAGAKRR